MMAVNKVDPKVIFASEAPVQDTPAVFTNKTVGWGESRKNGGRPTIKQMNALQQENDLKILWLNENSVTPYDASIDYPVNAVTIKDGAFKIFNGSVWNLFLNKSSVGLNNVDNTSDINKPISTATTTALNLKADKATTYTKDEVDTTIDLLKPPYLAYDVVDGNQTQDQINLYGGKKYDIHIGGYPLNARVLLDNGNIVKSTIANNTNDPNVDMTGWVNPSALQELHNKSSATFTDYLTPNEIANSSTTDLSAKLQAINDANEIGTLRIPDGVWYFNSPIVFNRDFSFENSPNAIFKFGSNGSIKFEGSATLIGKPTTAISKKSKTWGLVNTLNPYDLICIYNPNDYSFLPQRPYYKAGEFMKVFSSDGTSITTAGRTWEDYAAADVDIYKINPIKIKFNCFNVLADNSATNNPVTFIFCEGLSLFGYNNIGSKNAGVTLDRCYNFSIPEPCATNNSALVGLNYGVVISNSQNGRVSGGANIAGRHCVTFGGGASICSVPNREVIISNAVLKNGSTNGTGGGDFHGNTSKCQYINCFIDHASVGGVSNSFLNCTFWDRGIDGTALLFAELGGGYWNLIDCTLIVNNPLTSSRGALDIPFGEDLKEDFTLNIQDLKIVGDNTAAYYPIKFTVGAAVNITKKITCIIDGLDVTLPNHSSFVHANSANPAHANVIPNFTLIMRNVSSIKKGVYYIHPIPTATSPLTKLELPIQRGSQLITVPAGNTNGRALGSVVSFPYAYPVAPAVTYGLGTDGTWTVDSVFDLKSISCMYSTLTGTQLRFSLNGSAALPEKTFKVSWQASL